MLQTDTAAAIGAPTAATAGTASAVTLQTPFAATTDLYRGMPITLSGNPATARTALAIAYTSARVATLSRDFSPVLDTNTQALIPINQRLTLSDTEADWPSLTAYFYFAGQLMIGVGCQVANPRITLVAGQPGFIEYDIVGRLAANPVEAALPAGASAVQRPTPPRWDAGECVFNRAVVRGSRAVFGLGTQVSLPAAPEESGGFDLGQIVGRVPTADLSLYANSTSSPVRTGVMTAGSNVYFSAILGASAANRIGILFSPGRITRMTLGSEQRLDVDQITLEAALPNYSFLVTSW